MRAAGLVERLGEISVELREFDKEALIEAVAVAVVIQCDRSE
jgi:hypothetical protein